MLITVKRRSNKHASRRARKRKVRSRISWFAEPCNSHDVSHFAALFLDVGAKVSIVKSYSYGYCCCFFLIQNSREELGTRKKSDKIYSDY